MANAPKSKNGYVGETSQIGSLMNWRGVKTGYQSSRKITPSKHTKFVDGKVQHPNEVGELVDGPFRVLNEMRTKKGNLLGEMFTEDGKKVSLEDYFEMQMRFCHQRGSGYFFDEKLNIVKY